MLIGIVFLIGVALIFSGAWKNGKRWLLEWKLSGSQPGSVSGEKIPLRVGQAVSLTFEEAKKATVCQVAFVTRIEAGNVLLRTENNPTLRPRSPEVEAYRELKPGTKVTVEAAGENALFRFASSLLRVTPGTDYAGERLLVLPLPHSVKRVQRRKFFRAAFVTPATFALVPEGDPFADAIPVHGTLLDLSEGGFKADLGQALRVEEKDILLRTLQSGMILRVRLPIALFTEPVLARIVLAETGVGRGGLAVKVSAEFLPMEGWRREFIASHLFQLQRERLRAS